MSDLTFATKDPAVVISEALATYKSITGVDLKPADPRRLHLQAFVSLLAQQRALIDYSGKQNLLRYVDKGKPIGDAIYLLALAAFWGEAPLPAKPSETTLRFVFSVAGTYTIAAGKRATDGTNNWAVAATTNEATVGGVPHIDVVARCTVAGAATNGLAIGQIDTLVDSVPGCSGVQNATETLNGRDIEDTEAFRERLRSVIDASSVAGPRAAYEALAKENGSVEDAVALGPEDGDSMAGYPPGDGEVFILVMEVDAPTPSSDLLDAVETACTAETVRPITDFVTAKAPAFVEFNVDATYYIPRSRTAFVVEIQAAVAAAFEDYKAWQRKIGRDINPSKLNAECVNAGAKRLAISEPAFTSLMRDECSRIVYETLIYGGVEDD